MIKAAKAMWEVGKLIKRGSKIVGDKNLEKFLTKRKGLGKSYSQKIAEYAWKKPDSTLRRVNRINKVLDASPYIATGAAAVGTGVFLSRPKNKNNKNND